MGEYPGASGQPEKVFGHEAAGDIAERTLLTGRPSNDGNVVVPPAEDPEQTRRLPIFDAVESNWFGGNRKAPGGSGLPPRPGAVGRHQEMRAGVPRRQSIRRSPGARRLRGSPGVPRTRI